MTKIQNIFNKDGGLRKGQNAYLLHIEMGETLEQKGTIGTNVSDFG
jgi:hypothetical protein